MIIFLYLTLLVYLSMGIFLLRRFLFQKKKNPTTLIWAIAFLVGALAGSLYNPILRIPIFLIFILYNFSMLLLLAGTILDLTSRRILTVGLPIILALTLVVFHFWSFKTALPLRIEGGLGASLPAVLIDIFLSLVFAMVYAAVSFARATFKDYPGPLVLSIAFAFDGVVVLSAPLVLEDNQYFYLWYLLKFLAGSLIFLGIYLMDREAKELLELKRKIHGLSELPKV